MLELAATTKLLFIGDSITDCDRNSDPEKIGQGYVRLVRDYLRASDPETAPQVINRGISGNRVVDLADRWQRDVLDLAPDILSVKIGINDVWHGLGGKDGGIPVERFTSVYENLLAQVKAILPECRIVLCEPSVIWPPQPTEASDTLVPYIEVVRALGDKFDVECIVPLNGAFEDAKLERPDIDWAPDGVHPSSSGHMLIATSWLEATGLL